MTLLIVTISAKPLEKVSVQLLWLHQFEFAGFYMAKEKGYYQDVGLDVSIKEYKQGMNVVDEVVKQRSTFGISNSTLITDKASGKDIVALNAIYQNSPLVLIKMKDSPLIRVEDVKNKKIMASSSETNNASILTMLLSQGIKREDVQFIEHSFNLQDLISGKTDLMTAYISNQPYSFKELGFEIDMFNPKNYGFDFYADFIFTSKETISDDPVVVENFRRATLKGFEYAFSNILETVSVIEKKYNTQNKSRGALIYEANTLKKLAFTPTSYFGEIDKQRVYKIASSYQVLGFIDDEYSLDGFFYDYADIVKELHLTKQERQWLKKHPVIRVGVDAGWPPFEFVERGEYKGIAAEYMKIIEKKLGVNFEIQKNLSWNETLEAAKTKEIDLISCVTKTPQRSGYLQFTQPYLDFPMVIVTNDSVAYIRSLEELSFKKVAVVDGYFSDEMLSSKYKNIAVKRYANFKEALDALAKKEVYALVGNIAAVTYHSKKSGYTNLKISGITHESYQLAVGIRDDWEIFVRIMQKALDSITNQEREAIYNKWINLKYEMGFDYSLFWKVGVGATFVFLLIFYWNRRLAKEIRKREEAEAKLQEFNRDLQAKIAQSLEELERRNKIILKQSQQATMGSLIGVIAHQLKQPMYSMNLLVEAIEEMYDYNELTKENLDKVLHDLFNRIMFMNETLDEFRDFFKPDKKRKVFKISSAITRVEELLRAGFVNHSITLAVDIVEDIELSSYPGELQQVLMNIFMNAKDALVENHIDTPKVWLRLEKEGDYAVITIEDNAGGIAEEVQDKIFLDYFTTKEDKGTGIGLYLCKVIIEENMKGEITCSNSSRGAIFTMKLPLHH